MKFQKQVGKKESYPAFKSLSNFSHHQAAELLYLFWVQVMHQPLSHFFTSPCIKSPVPVISIPSIWRNNGDSLPQPRCHRSPRRLERHVLLHPSIPIPSSSPAWCRLVSTPPQHPRFVHETGLSTKQGFFMKLCKT